MPTFQLPLCMYPPPQTAHVSSSSYIYRSMPTFQLYLFGKKRDQFSGADVQRIQNMMGQVLSGGRGGGFLSLSHTHTLTHTHSLSCAQGSGVMRGIA